MGALPVSHSLFCGCLVGELVRNERIWAGMGQSLIVDWPSWAFSPAPRPRGPGLGAGAAMSVWPQEDDANQ